MHPILFNIGPYPVHAYGVLIAIGFLFGVALMRSEAKKRGWNVELIVDYCFMALLIGFIGCRIVFIITQWSYFMENPIQMLYIWEGGLVFYGGPLLVVPWTVWWTRKHKIDIREFGDVAVQTLSLAHAFGRLGCLMAGCCHGDVCPYPWGIRLTSDLVPPALRNIPLHPTQLYEAGLLLLLFAALRWRNRKPKFKGEVMLIYFMGYSVLRSFVEIFRGDTIRGFVIEGWVSTSQFISILAFTAALALYVYFWHRADTRRG